MKARKREYQGIYLLSIFVARSAKSMPPTLSAHLSYCPFFSVASLRLSFSHPPAAFSFFLEAPSKSSTTSAPRGHSLGGPSLLLDTVNGSESDEAMGGAMFTSNNDGRFESSYSTISSPGLLATKNKEKSKLVSRDKKGASKGASVLKSSPPLPVAPSSRPPPSSSSASHQPISHAQMRPLDAFILLQSANGSFTLNARFAVALSRSLEQLSTIPPELTSAAVRVLLTPVWVLYLLLLDRFRSSRCSLGYFTGCSTSRQHLPHAAY